MSNEFQNFIAIEKRNNDIVIQINTIKKVLILFNSSNDINMIDRLRNKLALLLESIVKHRKYLRVEYQPVYKHSYCKLTVV